MNIDDGKKSRPALKSYFVRNAIPTEGQFAELIDSALNQRDDGLVKPAGDPLSIEAVGDDSGFRKALNFYTRFTDADPAWTVSLRPRANPADPTSGRAGFSINDAAGNSRLAVDGATGRVGIGVVAPQEPLEVNGRVKAGTLSVGPWPANPRFHAFIGTNALDQTAAGNYALLQGAAGPELGRTFLNSPVDIRLRINNADRVVIANDGDVGIGTPAPAAKLDVAGVLRSQNLFGARIFKIECGATSPTAWQVYSPTGIVVNVDTRAAGFTAVPRYVCALHGTSMHFDTTGGSCPYNASAVGFQVYVKWTANTPLAPQNAASWGWHIQWIGIQS